MALNLRTHINQTLHLAVPVMFSQLGHVLVGVFDSVMVGPLGAEPLAAVSLANSIITVGLVFGIGVSYGSTPLVAAANGSGNKRRIALLLSNSLFLCVAAGLVISLLLFLSADFLPYLNQPEKVVAYAIPYFRISACSILPLMVFQGYRQFLEGLSHTRQAMVLSVACNLANIGLNYVFIYGKLGVPAMGVNGSAWATLLSRVLMAIAMGVYVHRARYLNVYHELAQWRFIAQKHIGRMLSIGLPSGMQMVLEVGAFSFSAIMIGWIGARALAAHQIAISMAAVTYMMASGLSAAATIRTGHFFGASDGPNLRLAGFSAIWLVFAFMFVNGLLFVLLRHQIPYWFIKETEVILIAADLLIIAAFFQLSDGVQVAALGALRGIEDVKIPTVITVIAYWIVALPFGYLCGFVFNWGAFGVWVGLGVGLSVAAVLLLLRFRQMSKRLMRNV